MLYFKDIMKSLGNVDALIRALRSVLLHYHHNTLHNGKSNKMLCFKDIMKILRDVDTLIRVPSSVPLHCRHDILRTVSEHQPLN